jgi:thiol:disulfide interchange protein
MTHRTTPAAVRTFAVLCALAIATAARAGGDWNDTGIKWMPYEEGLAAAKEAKKPVCLVIYTDWCPHCTNYSKVFHDPRVVEKSKDFVMMRLNGDQQKAITAKYAPDGQYIPRTLFLSADGTLDPDLNTGRSQFKYFYDEMNPASILAGMEAAVAKLKPAAPAEPKEPEGKQGT